MIISKTFWLVLGVGVPIGLTVGFSNISETATYADGQSQRLHESEKELLQAQAMQEARREQLGQLSNPAVQESDSSLTPAQRAAAAILARPHTPLERDMALKILNSQPGQVSDHSDYKESRSAGSAAPTGEAITARSGLLGRRAVDAPSASRAWLDQQQRTPTTDYRYRGFSETEYHYDLSDPSDSLRYSVDPMSQLNDSISIDPRREIDRSLGQYGGGIRP